MRLPACQLVTDLHNKYTTVFFRNQIFSFFWCLIRITVFQLLGSDKRHSVRQMFHCLWILIPYFMLHMFDDLEYLAHRIFKPGNVGLMSRSATNCYETVFMLTNAGIGQSTCVGVGGDMIPGSTFIDVLPLFEKDPETKAIIMIGEIGGNEEELAAEYIKKHVTKPVIALIAGKNAPKGRSMGHAGAIVSADGTGSAENKEKVLREAGVIIAETTTHIVDIVKDVLSK